MEKLKVLMKYAGISVFEYFPDADRLVLYDEQLKEERRMQPFLGRLEELCTVYPENREKLRGFLTGNIQFRFYVISVAFVNCYFFYCRDQRRNSLFSYFVFCFHSCHHVFLQYC